MRWQRRKMKLKKRVKILYESINAMRVEKSDEMKSASVVEHSDVVLAHFSVRIVVNEITGNNKKHKKLNIFSRVS
jgi:hypothetical protein